MRAKDPITIAVIVALAQCWNFQSSMAQERLYDPATTARILLTSSISDDDLLWAEPPVQVAPTDHNALYEIRVQWATGLLYYQIYPTSQAVLDTHALSVGLSSEFDRLPGKQIAVLSDSQGAGACGADLNVLVCAVSTYYSSPTPDGAAIQGVIGGLKHLMRVAYPQVAATSTASV
jgi:hypothetical protein